VLELRVLAGFLGGELRVHSLALCVELFIETTVRRVRRDHRRQPGNDNRTQDRKGDVSTDVEDRENHTRSMTLGSVKLLAWLRQWKG